MRLVSFLVIVLCLIPRLAAQEGEPVAKRYNMEVDEAGYPQKTPEVALKSVVQAVEDRRIDYLMAQLADPQFVDKRVAEYKGRIPGDEAARNVLAFDQLVKETTRYLQEDPVLVRELKRFAKEAEWKTEDTTASGSVKGVPGRQVFLRKIQGRWFLENRQK